MASPKKSSSRARIELTIALLLLLLIGTSLWFSFTNRPASNTAPDTVGAITSSPASRDIAVIQAQLELEKARAQKVRTQLRIRQQQAQQIRSAAAEPELDRDAQKQRIAEMIAAQLKGTEEKNQQLSQALKQKERELSAIKAQNKQLQNKIDVLGDSTRSLLAALDLGRDISASDQNYIRALQGDTDNNAAQPNAATADVDLINRIEVSDTEDAGSGSAELRDRIKQLMQADDGSGPAADTPSPTANQPADDLQSTINALFDNRDARAAARTAEQQFLDDSQYLESLDPMEEERSNETRWVTVRKGDTLSIIAQRVYDNAELYTKIYAANPRVLSNPDLIRTGQRLRVPE